MYASNKFNRPTVVHAEESCHRVGMRTFTFLQCLQIKILICRMLDLLFSIIISWLLQSQNTDIGTTQCVCVCVCVHTRARVGGCVCVCERERVCVRVHPRGHEKLVA